MLLCFVPLFGFCWYMYIFFSWFPYSSTFSIICYASSDKSIWLEGTNQLRYWTPHYWKLKVLCICLQLYYISFSKNFPSIEDLYYLFLFNHWGRGIWIQILPKDLTVLLSHNILAVIYICIINNLPLKCKFWNFYFKLCTLFVTTFGFEIKKHWTQYLDVSSIFKMIIILQTYHGKEMQGIREFVICFIVYTACGCNRSKVSMPQCHFYG